MKNKPTGSNLASPSNLKRALERSVKRRKTFRSRIRRSQRRDYPQKITKGIQFHKSPSRIRRSRSRSRRYHSPNVPINLINVPGTAVNALENLEENKRVVGKYYGPNLLHVLKDFDIYEVLGHGSYGVVLKICKSETNKCYAAKLSVATNEGRDMEIEYTIQGMVHAESGLTLKPVHTPIYFTNNNTKYVILIMELIYGDLEILDDFLKKPQSEEILDHIFTELIGLIEYMCKHNKIHGDLHYGNIIIKGQEKLMLLDFGFASESKCNVELSLLQLIRTTFPEITGGSRTLRRNMTHLRSKLLALYNTLFPTLPSNFRVIDTRWKEVVDTYLKSDDYVRLRV